MCISGVRFRKSARFELIELGCLPGVHGLDFSRLELGSAYGVARKLDHEDGTYRLLSCQAALLLLSLEKPGPLPAFVRTGANSKELESEVVRLVLDGLLEVECDGAFVSGPLAAGLEPFEAAPDSRLSAISLSALRWAAGLALPASRLQEVAAGLYGFNSLPLSAAQARRWPNRTVTAEWVDSQLGSAGVRYLRRAFAPVPSHSEGGWRSFTRKQPGLEGGEQTTFKLYVSPLPEAVPATWSRLIDLLPATKATAFKVGADARGILRSDKIVVYFAEFASLARAAALFSEGLSQVPPHGVPFTSEIAGDGLLSWGLDPPDAQSRDVLWSTRPSWRLWLVSRLAEALVGASNHQEFGGTVWKSALERLWLDGIDTATWTPRQSQFQLPVRTKAGLL